MDPFGAFGARQKHRVAEVFAAARVGENMGEENALVDFDSVLVVLPPRGFGGDLRPGRRQTGGEFSGGVDEIVEPPK